MPADGLALYGGGPFADTVFTKLKSLVLSFDGLFVVSLD